MKKFILPIMALCALGLTVPALAQTNEVPDATGPQAIPGPGDVPPDMPAMAPDGGGVGAQEMPPPDAAQPETAPATVQAQAGRPDKVILPRTAPPTASAQIRPQSSQPSTPIQSSFMPPTQAASDSPDDLRLNFNNVPLDMVLNYLSDAAGFVIVMETQVHGNVSVISSHPMTRTEAVDLLNQVLNQNGYAAIRNGRTLTIMDKTDAKTRDIPVQMGNDPTVIPKNDEIITQIIPIRYVDASQLVSDLSSFVSPQATIVANQAGNSIVVTDTQDNIRHLMEIIAAIDSSAAGETEIQVFHFNYANPNDVATELGQMFPSGNSQSQLPIRFGGPGGFFGRMMAAAAAANGANNNNRAQKQSEVTAVADARTQSVIVMASMDLMPEIAGMMKQLDVPSTRDQKVYTTVLKNADPLAVQQVLQTVFNVNSRGTAANSSSQQPVSAELQREYNNATTVSQTAQSLSPSASGSSSRGGIGGGGLP